MHNPIVIYHDKCPDGLAAAWVTWTIFGDLATYFPASYGDEPPAVVDPSTGDPRDVIIVDFSYPREKILRLHEASRSLLVLDHHATAESALAGLDFCKFDMSRSGAGLAWDVLHQGAPRPWLINYVEDRDLWAHRLPNTHEINAWLRSLPRTISAFNDAQTVAANVIIARGTAIIAEERVYIESVKARAHLAIIAGHLVPVVNCGRRCASEIVGELSEGHPFAASWEERDGSIHYELRSRTGGLAVNDIARGFGGGGHKMAAGFRSPHVVHVSAEGALDVAATL